MTTPASATTLVRAVAVVNRITLPATEQAFAAETSASSGWARSNRKTAIWADLAVTSTTPACDA